MANPSFGSWGQSDSVRRRRSGYRSLNDAPAVREWLESEKARKAARKAHKAAEVAAFPEERKAA